MLILSSLIISWFLRTVQYQKYEKAVKFLKVATKSNFGPKEGGTKQTQDFYKLASKQYEDYIKSGSGNKVITKAKMINDPVFDQIVDNVSTYNIRKDKYIFR